MSVACTYVNELIELCLPRKLGGKGWSYELTLSPIDWRLSSESLTFTKETISG